MPVLLDREGADVRFQENLESVKQYFGIFHDKKGAKQAIYKLINWFAEDYPKENKHQSETIRELREYKEKYKEVQRSLQILNQHKQLMEHAKEY